MILFKSLALSGLFRRTSTGIIRAIWSENPTLNRCHQVGNTYVSRERWPDIQWLRRFCTQSSEVNKDSVEDLLGDVEEGDNPYEGDLASDTFDEIAAGDPETLKKLNLLELEVALLREEEARVPDKLSKSNWLELLEIESLNQRKKFLAFLRLNELKRFSAQLKAENKRDSMLKYKKELGFHYYGLSGHTMFMRLYEKDLNRLLIHRLWESKLEILLDCSYQDYMSPINLRNCAKQIFYCFSEARLHRFPCQVKLFNCNREDALGKLLPKYVHGIYDNFYADIKSESFLNHYPKEKLVYLTPHTNNVLDKFSHDDIYIIGAFVDKGTGVKASLAKAKEHQLRMAKLPIDKYLIWKKGTKSLPLNVVLSILLDMAYYNDWNKAFQHVPSRCLTEN